MVMIPSLILRFRAVVLLAVVSFLLVPSRVRSRTWEIEPDGSGDAPAIRAALDSIAPGDTILLGPGVYTGPGNKYLTDTVARYTITSKEGAEATIVDMEGSFRFFDCYSGYEPVFEGMTFRNSSGAALYVSMGADPIIRNNRFEDNAAGIHCSNQGRPLVQDNVFLHNGLGGKGGALSGYNCQGMTIRGNLFLENSATDGGALWFADNSWADIEFNTFVRNAASSRGGAIYCGSGGSWNIANNTFVENGALSGGGIFCDQYAYHVHIARNIVAFSLSGEGIGCDDLATFITVEDCILAGNPGGDFPCGGIGTGNLQEDPLFCGVSGSGNYYLQSGSPAAPGNHASGEQIGAWPVGCGATAVYESTWGAIKARYGN
jgi:predicted outer membrane repeat protein